MNSVVYSYAVLLLALVGIQQLSCKYGNDVLRRVIKIAIQDLYGLPTPTPERTDTL